MGLFVQKRAVKSNQISLAENFSRYFSVQVADTLELKRCAYEIRHQVYCEELGWEPVNENKMEIDEFDSYSTTLLLMHKRTGSYAGTVRLVVPPPEEPSRLLPFEQNLSDSIYQRIVNPKALRRGFFGEISRLSVPAYFRRRVNESNTPFVLGTESIENEEDRRNFPNIAIGLYLSSMALIDMLNHTHLFFVAESRLHKRLTQLGFTFNQCGEEVDYHGIRAVYFCTRDQFFSRLCDEMKGLYAELKQQLNDQLPLYPYISIMENES